MVALITILLGFAAAVVLLLPLILRQRSIYERYTGSRLVDCPEDHRFATVSIDARRAAASSLDGSPQLRICDCSRWPERAQCAQPCLPQAARLEPYPAVERNPRYRQIYHLPILVAAFVGWYIGAIWHSQYLFRAEWMQVVGLTHAEDKKIVWWLSPHILTFAVCLLFAYGVAWLLAVWHRKGVLRGILVAFLLCAAVLGATAYGIATLPYNLLVMEAGYVLLATLSIGAIVGGLYDKLVLRSVE